MNNSFDDFGLEMDTCVFRMDEIQLKFSQTILLGTYNNGNGFHLYSLISGSTNQLICVAYGMDGSIKSHEIGNSISIKPFNEILNIKNNSNNESAILFLKSNNIKFNIVEEVSLPVAPNPPYDGPRLEDLTLPSPF